MSTLFVSDQTSGEIDNQNGASSPVWSRSGWSVRCHARTIVNTPEALVALSSLSGLLLYLILRQLIDPGYTNFLGYMIMQDAIAILFLLWLGWWLAPESQISRLTYILVVAEVWADSLGNAVHLYINYPQYDKVTHLGGGMAITAVAADLLFGIQRKRGHQWTYKRVILGAAAISLAFCVGWELYEYFGDRLVNSSRWKGWSDTNGDLIADFVGALIVLSLKFFLDPLHLRTNPLGHHVARERKGKPHLSGVVIKPVRITRLQPFEQAHIRRFVRLQRQRARVMGIHGDLIRIGLWFGIIAPFVAIVLIGSAALVTPSYSEFSDMISDLADQGQPHGYLIRFDMFVFGLATTAFGLSLSAILPRWHVVTGILFVIFGFSVAMAGVFRDYGEGPNMPHNREGFIHNTFGVTAIIAIVVAMIATTSNGSKTDEWRPLLWPGIAGIFMITTSVLLFLWGPTSLQGLVERIIYLSAGIWMMVAAYAAIRTREANPDRPIQSKHALRRSGNEHYPAVSEQ